ncbi:gag/pol polyprotein [Tanacetum coccineum]
MFSLKNILHVPEISHNLLYVLKFCHDNDVFFEFYTSYFVVKDESTHTTLLTGPSKHGLYTITLPQQKSINKVSFLAVRASPTIWHRRLGHPYQRLLRSMLSNFSLPVTNKSLSSFCNSCPLGKSSKLPLFESGFRKWRQAMKEEYDALMKNGTWSLVPRASNMNVVDGKCPIVNSTTIRAVLSLAVTNNWPLRQLDVHNAFLHRNLKEQALRAWFERLFEALFDLGFKGSKTDLSLFIYSRGYTLLYILVYVDDIIITVKHGMLICRSSGSTLQAFTDVLWKGNPDTSLKAFSDADWAGDSDDRWFAWGFTIYLGSNLISWTARKQRTVLRSSTEAEYKALADTVAKLTCLQALLHELGIRSSSTHMLWCDNLGATYLLANQIFCARTKHMEIDYHFVREKVAQGDLRVQHISTHDQIVYIFTKPLPTPRFLSLRSKLQVVASP